LILKAVRMKILHSSMEALAVCQEYICIITLDGESHTYHKNN